MANILIAGASRGIGLEMAKQYAKAGDRVYAAARNPDGAAKLMALAADYSNLSVHTVDIGDDASVLALAKELSGETIDVLINVAGIVGGDAQGLKDQAWDAWHDTLNIMTLGPLRMFQAFLPQMGEGAKLMNFSSQVAASTWPYGGLYIYRATKGALNQLMCGVAKDVADRGIIVGLIHPGYVQTDMGGPDAEITPEESASGIINTISNWKMADSGGFKKWTGEAHAF